MAKTKHQTTNNEYEADNKQATTMRSSLLYSLSDDCPASGITTMAHVQLEFEVGNKP